MNIKKLAVLAMGIAMVSCQSQDANEIQVKENPNDIKDKISYSIGFNIGRNIGKDSLDINWAYILQGLKDGYKFDTTKKEALMDEKQIQIAMDSLSSIMQKKQEKKMMEEQKKAEEHGKKLLAMSAKFKEEFAKKPGVKTTASGLMYRVTKDASGPSPKANQNVEIHLIGRLVDGTEFDNTYKAQPATIPVGAVVPGFKEILMLMKEGQKVEVFLPSALAYGANGAGNMIPPNADIFFELELLKIAGESKPMPAAPVR